MIVNDRDAKKTTDTETDVFLTFAGGSPAEGIVTLKISDGGTRISIDADRRISQLQDKLHTIAYRLDTPPIIDGPPRRRDYAGLISRLLEGHGYLYGARPETFGKFLVSVQVTDRFKAELGAWEGRMP